jgi:hypothetical protein
MRCEADQWGRITGQASGPCPNEATHLELWFDEEGVEVWLCDPHGDRPIDLAPTVVALDEADHPVGEPLEPPV